MDHTAGDPQICTAEEMWRGFAAALVVCCLDVSWPLAVGPRRFRCWVRGRYPKVWNLILRLTNSFTGWLRFRADAAANRQCVHGQSLPPKPEPKNFDITRTFSGGTPSIALMASC